MTLTFVLQLITLALKEGPFLASTAIAIKNLLAKDPAVPDDLKAILAETTSDYNQTLADIERWSIDNPQV